MADMETGEDRPYRYEGQIIFDVPGAPALDAINYATGGHNRGSAPFGVYPITSYVAKTPKYGLEGFALNDAGGNIPDPKYPNAARSGIMLHLATSGKTLDKLISSGCLVVTPKEWPKLRDQIIDLQKQGYDLVAHLDTDGRVTIRPADAAATDAVSEKDFIDTTTQLRGDTRAQQTALAKAGFDPGPVDGISGPRTKAAVKAFQEANGLVADGIVGPKTAAALGAPQAPVPMQRPAALDGGNAGPAYDQTFGATAGDIESPFARLGTTKLGWEGDEASWNGMDIREPMDPGAYARARLEAVNVGGAADPRMAALVQPKSAPPAIPASPVPFPSPPRPGAGIGAVAGLGGFAGGAEGVVPPALVRTSNAPPVVPPSPQRAATVATAPPPIPEGGFDLGAMLGGLGSNVQAGLNTIGTTANKAIEGTKTALDNTAKSTADLLKNELIGTVKGRTLLLNTMLNLPPPGTHDPFRYGKTSQERQENARRRQAMIDGVPYIPSTAVRTSLDIPVPRLTGSPPKLPTRTASGRTGSSTGETFDSVWLEAKGLL